MSNTQSSRGCLPPDFRRENRAVASIEASPVQRAGQRARLNASERKMSMSRSLERKPEKRFTATFSMEGPEFQNRLTVSGIMNILGMIKGNVATGKLNGEIRAGHARKELPAGGDVIGEWKTTWRRDAPSH
jgi:hypothetical protein